MGVYEIEENGRNSNALRASTLFRNAGHATENIYAHFTNFFYLIRSQDYAGSKGTRTSAGVTKEDRPEAKESYCNF